MRHGHFSKNLKNLTASHVHNEERVFQAEGMLSANTLRWERVWQGGGASKDPAQWRQSELRGREKNVRSERGRGVSKPVCVTWRCGLSLWCGGSHGGYIRCVRG